MSPDPSLPTLLRGVSRSFYLSIRLLPGSLRAPVGIAYLMARAMDTVADAARVPAADRLALLDALGASVAAAEADHATLERVRRIAGHCDHPQERALLLRLDRSFAALRALQPEDLADVQQVLRHIVRGQALDLHRFGDGAIVRVLPDAAALEDYAYLVAGSVGEFWTDLCARHLTPFARLPVTEMRRLGRSFGIGLQLVNILRDVGEDLAAGRCYLPVASPPPDMATWSEWIARAQARMADGFAYADAIESRRVRAAVALPAILGQRTLAHLQAAGADAFTTRVKVPRGEVRMLMLRLAAGLASRGTVRAQWDNPAR